MPRCIIIAPLYQGEERALVTPQEGDVLICADGGCRAALRFGLRPTLTIGDFDSMPVSEVQGERIILPVEKDDTDLVVCLREGRKRGYREFIAAGCLGGRFDHTIGALQCAADCALRGESLWLCDIQNRVTVLRPGMYAFPALPGRKLSLLAYTPVVKGVTLQGAKWELTNAELTHRWPLGCSNEWVAPEATLTFAEGLLLVSFSADSGGYGMSEGT